MKPDSNRFETEISFLKKKDKKKRNDPPEIESKPNRNRLQSKWDRTEPKPKLFSILPDFSGFFTIFINSSSHPPDSLRFLTIPHKISSTSESFISNSDIYCFIRYFIFMMKIVIIIIYIYIYILYYILSVLHNYYYYVYYIVI